MRDAVDGELQTVLASISIGTLIACWISSRDLSGLPTTVILLVLGTVFADITFKLWRCLPRLCLN